MRRIVCIVGALLASGALAQTTVSTAASSSLFGRGDEKAQVRLRYGVAIRSGNEADLGPGLSYSGVSPNDLAFAGWLWFLLGDHLGLTGGVQREGFSLLDGQTAVTTGGLVRAHLGPTGRLRLGPARLEAAASYTFQQLPVFGTLATPSFATVQRHGVLLAARGLVDLGPVTVEGRFEYPLALATVGRAATSEGLGVGGGVRVQLFRTGSLAWGLMADVQWHRDSVTTTDASAPLSTSQSVVRAGLALDAQWKDPRLDGPPTTGSVRVVVRGEGGPLEGARVLLAGRALTSGADGVIVANELEPGPIVARAEAAGYDAADGKLELAAGETRQLELVLTKVKPKVGRLVVQVVSFEGKTAVADATLVVNGQTLKTDARGVRELDGLSPGPLVVKVSSPGFTPAEEAVSIVAGASSELSVVLVPEKKRVPATVSGQVRSARGGAAVAAQLEIRELKQTIAADEKGAFSVQIPGGKYTVRISAPKFVSQTKSVTVRDGDQAIFNVDLAPK